MIPFVGWASTGGKFAVRGNDLYQVRNVVSTEKMESVYSPTYQDVLNSPLGKTQNQLDLLSNTPYQLGTPNALTFNMPPAKTEIPSIGAAKGSRIEVPYGAHIGKVGNRKVLETNVKYETTEGYTYETNEFGRIDSVDAELQLGKGTRNRYAQSNVGETDRIRGNYPERDDGVHLIGSQFKGTGDIDNLVPMNSQINEAGGKWHQMEQEWASALGKEGGSAKVKIKPQYTGSSARPDNFIVEYSIDDGRVKKVTVQNQNGG
ncbi:DNA/RNA non-specific endonuclease [Sporosarcina sp. E16_8]|nr:DNA/RNA non-specific endonuclease [Sporosarcina sp. E16_8]